MSTQYKKGGIFSAPSCVIYARFSPRPDASDSDSAATQVAICTRYAEQKGCNIVATFSDEAVSGSTDLADRPGLLSAIAALKKGGILLVMKRDRIARDLLVGLQIERVVESRKAAIVCAEGEPFGSDPNAVLMKQMLMVVAEWERKMIADRTRTAMREKMRSGYRLGGKVPYGFMVDPATPGRVIENPDEMPTLRLIKELHDKGLSNRKVAASLDPLKSRQGKWHPEVVRHILQRLEYCPLPD